MFIIGNGMDDQSRKRITDRIIEYTINRLLKVFKRRRASPDVWERYINSIEGMY